jgi:hypothetical protein
MTTNNYMADVLACFHEKGRELDCLEKMSNTASEAGQPRLVELVDRLAAQCEDTIAHLHAELIAAGWGDE